MDAKVGKAIHSPDIRVLHGLLYWVGVLLPYRRAMKPQLLGACTQITPTATGLHLATAEAQVRVTFLGTQGVRIQIDPAGRFEANPYALVPEAIDALTAGHGFAPDDDAPEGTLRYAAAHASLEIQLNPLRFTLQDAGGHVLCADDAGLGTSFLGTETTIYKALQPGERFIGLGEKTGPLDRRGRAYTQWNTDYFGYGEDADPLYLSTPFYMGLHQGRCYGLFLVNSHRSTVNLGASTERFASVTTEAGAMDYVLMAGAGPGEVLRFYTELTGRTPLPPRWALGLQQCRYSYYPASEVRTLAETYRRKQMPADVIYLDIHYMDAYKVFTWHPDRFADPAGLLADLKAMGFEVVVIFDPGIKVEPGYAAYDEGLAGDHFVRYPDGSLYQGQVWPGWCHFPDFTRPETRAWWAAKVREVTDTGVAGLWTDMNEPATWGQRIPEVLLHDMEGHGGTHKEAHNLYGMQMARATAEGAAAARPGKRPFVLTRAGFAGIQRHAAVWTGDNVASDAHMLLGARMLNSMGLAGVGFAGTDIGGFVGDADRALFARWMTIGAFAPLCRIHTMIDSRDSEPWAYGEKTEAISQNFVGLRYRLMPLMYSLFKEMEETGLPVQRSLALSDPWAWETYDPRFDNQFMVGCQLLVAPVSAQQQFAQVFLPERGGMPWYYLYDDSRYPAGMPTVPAPLERLPVFVPPGAMVPMRSLVQHEGQADDGVLTLHLYHGDAPTELDLYWDEGDGYAYRHGRYHRRRLQYDPAGPALHLAAAEGILPAPWQTLRLVLHGFGEAGTLLAAGGQVPLHSGRYAFVESLPAFDPFGNDATAHSCPVQEAVLAYGPAALTVALPG